MNKNLLAAIITIFVVGGPILLGYIFGPSMAAVLTFGLACTAFVFLIVRAILWWIEW